MSQKPIWQESCKRKPWSHGHDDRHKWRRCSCRWSWRKIHWFINEWVRCVGWLNVWRGQLSLTEEQVQNDRHSVPCMGWSHQDDDHSNQEQSVSDLQGVTVQSIMKGSSIQFIVCKTSLSNKARQKTNAAGLHLNFFLAKVAAKKTHCGIQLAESLSVGQSSWCCSWQTQSFTASQHGGAKTFQVLFLKSSAMQRQCICHREKEMSIVSLWCSS